MNVLIEFGSGAEDFDEEVYAELLDSLVVDQCVVTYHNKNSISNRKIEKYITQSFCASPMYTANYVEAIKQVGEIPLLDDELMAKMAPYEHEIMTMLLRWSKGEYTDIWHDYCEHLRFWNHVLNLYKIDAFFTTEIIHSGYNFVIFLLCKIRGIAYFSTQRLSYPERLYVAVDVYNQLPFFMEEYRENYVKYKNENIKEIPLRDDMQEMYNFYTGSGNRTPIYMTNQIRPMRRKWTVWLYDNMFLTRWLYDTYKGNTFIGKRSKELFKRLIFIFGLTKRIFSFSINTNEFFTDGSVSSNVFRESDTFLSYYEEKTTDVSLDEKYIYVPLHYQPEQTTSPLGGKFVDQLRMIRMLSFYLPKGWKLYIKEHPTFANSSVQPRATWRSKQFYDELTSIFNVCLVSMSVDTYLLIENSQAVAVVTGTAGLEAITQGKPCIMFGYSYMQYAPNVFAVRNNDDCAKVMEKLKVGIRSDDLAKKIRIYFKTLENYFFKGKILWYNAAYRPNYEKDRAESKINIVNAYIKEIKRLLGDDVLLKDS